MNIFKKYFNPLVNYHVFCCPKCGKVHHLYLMKNKFMTCDGKVTVNGKREKCRLVTFTKAFPWSSVSDRELKKINKYASKTT